eukprot:1158174-Pelagomonas_calceolata.AAC.8
MRTFVKLWHNYENYSYSDIYSDTRTCMHAHTCTSTASIFCCKLLGMNLQYEGFAYDTVSCSPQSPGGGGQSSANK